MTDGPAVIDGSCPVEDQSLTDLHRLAFGAPAGATQAWARRLERHSLTWVGAFRGDIHVGFVQVVWDGGAHAFLLDTVAHPDQQGQGIGRELVGTAAAEAETAGCHWLHVDYEPTCSTSTATAAVSNTPRQDC